MANPKKTIAEMMPVKKWLSTSEACSYLDISVNTLVEIATNQNITISMIGKTKRYKLSDIDKFLNTNIIVKAK